MAPQLAHPERLRDLHRLACHVQVYEALAQQRADEFFEAIQTAGHRDVAIQPLTEEVIVELGLKEFLTRRPRPAQDTLRDPTFVRPFDCFFSLRVTVDPTAQAAAQSEADSASTGQDHGEASRVTAPAPTGSPTGAAPTLRRDIPERFQKPWEFQFARDEVLYDMNVGRSSRRPLSTLIRRIGRRLLDREEHRKWRALLCVKNLEEQLWGVRPPRGAVTDPAVRDWARQTLEAEGYDGRAMLLEWEIFWRRKGV
jgi:hypothetical protein